jgi:hypothetical protein
MSKQRLSRPWVCVAGVGLFWATTWALRASINTVDATVPDPAGPSLVDDGVGRAGSFGVGATDVGSDGTAGTNAAGGPVGVNAARADPVGADAPLAEAAGDTADVDDPPPASQPAVTPGGSGRTGGHGGAGNHRRAGGRFGAGPPTPEQQEQAMEFLAQHAPNQANAIKVLPDLERARTEAAIGQAYLNYQRIEADDQELYAVILNRVEVEDRIFGLGGEYRRAKSDAARSSVRADLLTQLHAWASVNLKERKLRLDRLKRTVSQAEDKLADDSAHRDRMIDERLNRITRSNADVSLPTTGGTDDTPR